MKPLMPLFAASMLTLLPACNIGSGLPFSGQSPSNNYQPIIDGAKWEYDVLANGTKSATMVITTTLVSTEGGTTKGSQRIVTKNLTTNQETVSTSTLTRTSDSCQDADSKGNIATLLKYPLEVGSSWGSSGMTLSVKSKEDVSVPAGSYKSALRIEATQSGSTVTKWVDKDTGMIKVVMGDSSNEITMELTKFSK